MDTTTNKGQGLSLDEMENKAKDIIVLLDGYNKLAVERTLELVNLHLSLVFCVQSSIVELASLQKEKT